MSFHSNGRLLIRADAGVAMGTGHVMRCHALAQSWCDQGGDVLFACAEIPSALEGVVAGVTDAIGQIEAPPGSRNDAEQTIAMARRGCADWIVVDGYHFDRDYQQTLKNAGLSLLVVDDIQHAQGYPADVVLNQNLGASEAMYRAGGHVPDCLLGPKFSLLRREFKQRTDWQRTFSPQAHRVLVTLGGSDPDNVTQKIVEALQRMTPTSIDAKVIVGGASPHLGSLQSAAAGAPHIQLLRNVSSMSTAMQWADVAIAAGGSTLWELALMGLPTLLVTLADNQVPNVTHAHELGMAFSLGWGKDLQSDSIEKHLQSLCLCAETRMYMSRRGRELVDGHGCERVIQALHARAAQAA